MFVASGTCAARRRRVSKGLPEVKSGFEAGLPFLCDIAFLLDSLHVSHGPQRKSDRVPPSPELRSAAACLAQARAMRHAEELRFRIPQAPGEEAPNVWDILAAS